MKFAFTLAIGTALTGCGYNTDCYGPTDTELLQTVQEAYADSRMTPKMAQNFRLEEERVIAVERYLNEGEGAHAGLLFSQDDGSVVSIRLFEDCSIQTSAFDSLNLENYAYPLTEPNF